MYIYMDASLEHSTQQITISDIFKSKSDNNEILIGLLVNLCCLEQMGTFHSQWQQTRIHQR